MYFLQDVYKRQLLEHGFIDQIVEREKLRETLGKILKLHPSQPDRTAQTKEEEMQNKKQSEKEEEKLCQIREMTCLLYTSRCV